MLLFLSALVLSVLHASHPAAASKGLRSLSMVSLNKMPRQERPLHTMIVKSKATRSLEPFSNNNWQSRRILQVAAAAEDEYCLPCHPGSFSSADANGGYACMPCSPGTYSNTSASASCLECPPGYEDAFNRTGCTKCMPGFSSAGGKACSQCNEGYFSAVQGSSQCMACSRYFSMFLFFLFHVVRTDAVVQGAGATMLQRREPCCVFRVL